MQPLVWHLLSAGPGATQYPTVPHAVQVEKSVDSVFEHPVQPSISNDATVSHVPPVIRHAVAASLLSHVVHVVPPEHAVHPVYAAFGTLHVVVAGSRHGVSVVVSHCEQSPSFESWYLPTTTWKHSSAP